ncbi:MAG: hypothetical protein AB9836_06905 [Aminipila sp.]
MRIYSLDGLEEVLGGYNTIEILNEVGEMTDFKVSYTIEKVVNMPYVGTVVGNCNSQGWLRDNKYFFRELLNIYPECFSEENMEKIQRGRNPICDEMFVKAFPEFSKYKGEKLVHHHIGKDGQAVALPQSCHIGSGGIHNFDLETGITNNAERFSDEVQIQYGENPLKYSWEDAQKIADKINALDLKKNAGRQATKKSGFGHKSSAKKNSRSAESFIKPLFSKISSIITPEIREEAKKIFIMSIFEGIVEISQKYAENKEIVAESCESEVVKEAEKYEPQHGEGSGTSKAPHDRSGHIRHCKDGREIPIPPAKVNGGKK